MAASRVPGWLGAWAAGCSLLQSVFIRLRFLLIETGLAGFTHRVLNMRSRLCAATGFLGVSIWGRADYCVATRGHRAESIMFPAEQCARKFFKYTESALGAFS